MDRRRFVPSSEALDGRTLLSGTGLFGQSTAHSASSLSTRVPDTFNEKLLRIQRLPFYLDNLQSQRFLPKDTLQSLQTNITGVAAQLLPAPPAVLRAFNLQIRKMMPKVSLSPQDTVRINNLFGAVLRAEGASPQQVAKLQQNMLSIAKADAASPNPVYLATNDYSILVQGISIIGRRIEAVGRPLIALGTGVRVKAGLDRTTDPTPTFVGTYRPSATVDPGTRIQIVDLNGNVLGSGAVLLSGGDGGRYRITLDTPLQPGVNWLRSQAIDAQGHTSKPSAVFAVNLVSR